ncbi:MAG: hypothetical protein U0704_06090 [Candidatus Eisenbacteria bacterium]
MKTRTLGLVAIALALAFLLAGQIGRRASESRARAADVRPAAATAPALPPAPLDPGRPAPDVRFAAAVREMYVLSGAPAPRVEWTFDAGHWSLSIDGAACGEATAYPRWPELWALLARVPLPGVPNAPERAVAQAPAVTAAAASASAAPSAATIADAPALLDGMRAFEALELADRAWARGERGDLVLGTAERALLVLHVQANDQVGAADTLLARAWALAALRERGVPGAGAADASLLAVRMGYGADACLLAERLGTDDAIGAYVRHDDARLASLAARSGSAFERYLVLTRCAERHDGAAWNTWNGRWPAPANAPRAAWLASAIACREFTDTPGAARELFAAMSELLRLEDDRELGHARDRREPPLGAVSDAFERALAKRPVRAPGPLLDAAIVQAWARSQFYSALWAFGTHLRDVYSSVEDSRRFDQLFGEPREPVAAEFVAWQRRLTEAKSGEGRGDALAATFVGLPHFGENPLEQTWVALRALPELPGPDLRAAAHAFDARLDTRPSQLFLRGFVHGWPLFELGWSQELLEAAQARVHPDDVTRRVYWAMLSGDRAELARFARDGALDDAMRAYALAGWAESEGDRSPGLREACEAFYRERPHSQAAVGAWADYCMRTGRPDRARDVARAWLSDPARDTGAFDAPIVQRLLAESWSKLGRQDSALAAIAPACEFGQNAALLCEVRILEAMGRLDEAEEVARDACSRYSDDSGALAALVRVLWRKGAFDVAARTLTEARFTPTSSDWAFELGPSFATVFARRGDAGRQAADVLARTGGPMSAHVWRLAECVRDSGDAVLAIALLRGVRASPGNKLAYAVIRWDWMRQAGARDSALAELGRVASRESAVGLSILACTAYGRGADELLWALPEPAEPGDDLEYLWLLRAAAHVERPGPHRAELGRHYANPGGGRYATIARWMLGEGTEAQARAEAHDARQVAELDWYAGVLARSRGDVREAARLFARVYASDVTGNAEYSWAYGRLAEWWRSGRSLERRRSAVLSTRATRETAGGRIPPAVSSCMIRRATGSRRACRWSRRRTAPCAR